MQIKKHQKPPKLRSGIKLGRKGRKRSMAQLALNTSHIPWFSYQVLTTRKTAN